MARKAKLDGDTDGRSEWLARKLVQGIRGAGLTPGAFARLLAENAPEGMAITRSGVYDWCKTGRIDKRWLPLVAKLLGVKVDGLLAPEIPLEAVVDEDDVSPEESNLVLAFRDLLPEQQQEYLRLIRAKADENRAVAERFAKRYGKFVPDGVVADHIQPAPKAKSKRKL